MLLYLSCLLGLPLPILVLLWTFPALPPTPILMPGLPRTSSSSSQQARVDQRTSPQEREARWWAGYSDELSSHSRLQRPSSKAERCNPTSEEGGSPTNVIERCRREEGRRLTHPFLLPQTLCHWPLMGPVKGVVVLREWGFNLPVGLRALHEGHPILNLCFHLVDVGHCVD